MIIKFVDKKEYTFYLSLGLLVHELRDKLESKKKKVNRERKYMIRWVFNFNISVRSVKLLILWIN